MILDELTFRDPLMHRVWRAHWDASHENLVAQQQVFPLLKTNTMVD